MQQYNLNFTSAKAYPFEFLENSCKASQNSKSLRDFRAGETRRLCVRGVPCDDFIVKGVSGSVCASVPTMQVSPYKESFFGVGGDFFTPEGRREYDKRAFSFVDEFQKNASARLSKTSSFVHGSKKRPRGGSAVHGGKSAKNAGFPESSIGRPAPCAERALFTDSCSKRSVFNDYNDDNFEQTLERLQYLERRFGSSSDFRPYPVNYPFEYSTDNGGGFTDDRITIDDKGKLSFNLLESRLCSVPSIKPFFDNYDLIKNPNSGSFCGFDGGCQLSLFGFWKSWDNIKALITEVGEVKEYLDIKGLKCASMEAFNGLDAWKVSFCPGRGQMFGHNVRLPFCLSRGGLEIFFNVDVSEETLDFSKDGMGGEKVLLSCMTREGREKLLSQLVADGENRQEKINEHFRALAGGSSDCQGAFVLPCGGKSKAARVSVGVVVGAQVFRTLGLSFIDAGRLAKQILSRIGFVATDELIGRFDFGFITDRFSPYQLHGWALKDENGKNVDYRFVSPACGPSMPPGCNRSSFCFGKRPGIFQRIYDKDKELLALQTKDGGDKLQYFYNTLGDEFIVNAAATNKPLTRCEWEYRRDFLQNVRLVDGSVLHIRTLEDLQKALPAVIKYTVKTWFRITEKNIVDGHSNEAKIWDVWEEVGDACIEWAAWLTSNENREVPKLLRVTKNLEKLPDEEWAANKTARGFGRYLVSQGHLDFNRDLTEDEMISEAVQLVKRYKRQINRSWHREGSELFDRQRLFDSGVVPSGSDFKTDISSIPDLIVEDDSFVNGTAERGVFDDR